MDPTPLANPEWTDIGNLLAGLWIIVGLIVFMATNVIIGHIFIPSLVASYHLPSQLQKARPVFYALAIAAFGLAVLVLVLVIDLADVIARIYETYWIDGGLD